MAPTIIRVKRKFDEFQDVDPNIVLNCKKLKANEKEVYSKFSFVGTVEEKQDEIPDQLLKLSKKEVEALIQNKSKDLSTSLNNRLSENSNKSKEKRFKVVNFLRSTRSSDESSSEKQIIFDVEKDDEVGKSENVTSNAVDEKIPSYVYDIYVAQEDFSTILKDDMIDFNDLSILDYNDYLYSCPRLTNEGGDDELQDDYDEDSNDENHWRNDYPDEEGFSDASSMDERAIRRAMQNFELEDELSSDNDEEDVYHQNKDRFLNSIDADSYGFDDDYDYANTGFGSSYAKYKKRMLKDMGEKSESSTDSEE